MHKILLVGLLFVATIGDAADRPNIIVILADDQGWGDLSIHGNSNLSTPNIDRLATEGVQFKNFYVQPVCSPTRAEFLTGRYYPRSGVYSTGAGGERIDADEETIGDVFKAAGYATGAFGKWHSGTQAPYHPNTRGFDEYYGFTSGHWGSYFDAIIDHNGEMETSSGYLPDALTSKTLEFISSNAEQDKVFFAYLALPTPHSPMQTTDEGWARFDGKDLASLYHGDEPENLNHTRAALAMVENIDLNVGRVLDHIHTLDIADNTIVVYFTDNGPNGWRWNGGMRGRKGSTDEGGVRSPFFVRWPDKLPAGKEIEQIAGAIDILPTLGAMAGIDRKPRKTLDGINLFNTIAHPESIQTERSLISYWSGRVSARNQRFRLDHEGLLYDIESDRGQTQPVNDTFPGVARTLSLAVENWKSELLVDHDTRRPLTVGFSGLSTTQLPARDASWTGGIKRSNRWPNCSYLLNWTNPNEYIYWNALIGKSGRFKAIVHYTCAEENAGLNLVLQAGSTSTTATVDNPHNPPAYGMEFDRVPREESYVKDFATMDLGEIDLQQGPVKLKLRAEDFTGKQAIEFRMLTLEKTGQ